MIRTQVTIPGCDAGLTIGPVLLPLYHPHSCLLLIVPLTSLVFNRKNGVLEQNVVLTRAPGDPGGPLGPLSPLAP